MGFLNPSLRKGTEGSLLKSKLCSVQFFDEQFPRSIVGYDWTWSLLPQCKNGKKNKSWKEERNCHRFASFGSCWPCEQLSYWPCFEFLPRRYLPFKAIIVIRVCLIWIFWILACNLPFTVSFVFSTNIHISWLCSSLIQFWQKTYPQDQAPAGSRDIPGSRD